MAFALVAQAWMPPIDTLAKALDLVTGEFAYVRFIGDRKDIEAKTKKWDHLVEDKTAEMTVWTNELKKIVTKGVKSYAFSNNHYAGFGPETSNMFREMLGLKRVEWGIDKDIPRMVELEEIKDHKKRAVKQTSLSDFIPK